MASMVCRSLMHCACDGSAGLQYTLGRVPLGGCDFSPFVYTYDDTVDDYELVYFNLSQHDYDVRVCNVSDLSFGDCDVRFR